MNPDGRSGGPQLDSDGFWAWFGGLTQERGSPKPLDTVPPRSISLGYSLSGSVARRQPSPRDKRRISAKQGNRCLYCGNLIGSQVLRDDRPVTLRSNWDHFVPWIYARNNRGQNWVLACHICNSIKSCHLFSTVLEAQQFIRAKLAARGVMVLGQIGGPSATPVPQPATTSVAVKPDDTEQSWMYIRSGLISGASGMTYAKRGAWTRLGTEPYEARQSIAGAADIIWYIVPGDPDGQTVALAVMRATDALISKAISVTFSGFNPEPIGAGGLEVRPVQEEAQ